KQLLSLFRRRPHAGSIAAIDGGWRMAGGGCRTAKNHVKLWKIIVRIEPPRHKVHKDHKQDSSCPLCLCGKSPGLNNPGIPTFFSPHETPGHPGSSFTCEAQLP